MLIERGPEMAVNEPLGKRYLTVDEVADYLGLSRVSIYRMVIKRMIPFIPMVTGHKKRFDRKAIDEWMVKKTIKPRRVV